jgi:dihydrofolate synthase/folylpolyglutamate synthase
MRNITETAIEKIHEFERFGSILGLERMTRLLELLGNPQDDLKVIHVAGTNGKGSVSRYVYSVLQEAGYKTGLYTSPFLEKFNERIEFNRQLISDKDLAFYTDRVLAAVDIMTGNGEQSPTEFEVVTAIAFVYFKDMQCDYLVLEVGLGGTGDSTNVCKNPLMTVITSISLDHTDRLGDTIEEIAMEKAGIIKHGCPVITSAKDMRALKVIEKVAKEHESPIFETANLPVEITEESLKGSKFNVSIKGDGFDERFHENFDDVEISMIGSHQIENAVVALSALKIMEANGNLSLSREALYRGLKTAYNPGRFEVIEHENQPIFIIDGAHNQAGAEALKKTVAEHCKGKRILMIAGMLADKDIHSIISEFSEITKDFIVTEPDNPRKIDAQNLAEQLENLGCNCQVCQEPRAAYETALARKNQYDVIICAGSLYLIGKMRSLLI